MKRSVCGAVVPVSKVKSKQVPYLITSIGLAADPGFFAGSQPAGDISHKPAGRLPLLSTRPVVTFPAKEITFLGRYQIIQLGDRGTQV